MELFAVASCLLSCISASIAMGFSIGKALDAVARQPEAAGKINTILLLGLALTESAAIYGFVTALIMMLTR